MTLSDRQHLFIEDISQHVYIEDTLLIALFSIILGSLTVLVSAPVLIRTHLTL
jgi:hypothetical protein